MRRKILVSLPPDAYEALVLRATEDERAVDQQASFLLKRAVLADVDARHTGDGASPKASR